MAEQAQGVALALVTSARTGKIAFQGEPGANSDAACREKFPNMETIPCPTFEDAFDAVTSGRADLAMIPVENNIAGRVADIHRLLPDSGLHIIGEHFLPIHFHLAGVAGATLDDIVTVRSHVHALAQCRKVILRHNWTPQVADDTAGSAREVAERGDLTVASLCPPRAASQYGLQVLAKNVEDEHHNTTRFVILSRDAQVPAVGSGNMITSFVFQVRNVSASLYKALGGFATNGVNMTKLESYQLGGGFFATRFYADVEGHPEDPQLALALEELQFFSVHVRIMGTYPASGFRATIAEASDNRELRPVAPTDPLLE